MTLCKGDEISTRPGAPPEPLTHPDASKDSSNVIIIGAGMSGLCAACALKNAGFSKITIIEARDYIGGRTITKEIGNSGVMVDFGAAWIHGTEDNPLIAMCDAYNLPYISHPEMKTSNAAVVDLSDGSSGEIVRVPWTTEEIEKLLPLVYEVIATLKPGVSASEAFKVFLECNNNTNLTDTERQRAQFLMERTVSGCAGPMEDLNVFFPMTQETGRLAKGYDQLIVGGYNSLVAKLAEAFDIEVNREVAKIEYMEKNKKVMIACKDGSEYSADFVISSLPLGVMKSGSIDFSPALPEKMSGALDRLAMGGFEKVILVFDEHFYKGWKENMEEFKDNKILVNADGTLGSSPFSLWIDISGKTTKPTLVCLYDGAFAIKTQTDKTKTDDDIVNEAMKYLALGLGKSVDEIPKPVATACTRWHTDPYSYGAYSYIPVGAIPEDMDTLAEPIYDGRVMFCGEHTMKEHNASVHGPVLSGLREARRLSKEAHLKKVIPGIIPKK